MTDLVIEKQEDAVLIKGGILHSLFEIYVDNDVHEIYEGVPEQKMLVITAAGSDGMTASFAEAKAIADAIYDLIREKAPEEKDRGTCS